MNIYETFLRTTSFRTTKCTVCDKMAIGTKVLNSDCKSYTTEGHTDRNSIPGFFAASQVRKPFDTNLSPFIGFNSKPIQYGDTSIASVSTDNPAWSPGNCLILSNYEGKFIRKKTITSSPVIVCVLKEIFLISCYRTQPEQERPRSERLLLERKQVPTVGGEKFNKRKNTINSKNVNCQR